MSSGLSSDVDMAEHGGGGSGRAVKKAKSGNGPQERETYSTEEAREELADTILKYIQDSNAGRSSWRCVHSLLSILGQHPCLALERSSFGAMLNFTPLWHVLFCGVDIRLAKDIYQLCPEALKVDADYHDDYLLQRFINVPNRSVEFVEFVIDRMPALLLSKDPGDKYPLDHFISSFSASLSEAAVFPILQKMVDLYPETLRSIALESVLNSSTLDTDGIQWLFSKAPASVTRIHLGREDPWLHLPSLRLLSLPMLRAIQPFVERVDSITFATESATKVTIGFFFEILQNRISIHSLRLELDESFFQDEALVQSLLSMLSRNISIQQLSLGRSVTSRSRSENDSNNWRRLLGRLGKSLQQNRVIACLTLFDLILLDSMTLCQFFCSDSLPGRIVLEDVSLPNGWIPLTAHPSCPITDLKILFPSLRDETWVNGLIRQATTMHCLNTLELKSGIWYFRHEDITEGLALLLHKTKIQEVNVSGFEFICERLAQSLETNEYLRVLSVERCGRLDLEPLLRILENQNTTLEYLELGRHKERSRISYLVCQNRCGRKKVMDRKTSLKDFIDILSAVEEKRGAYKCEWSLHDMQHALLLCAPGIWSGLPE